MNDDVKKKVGDFFRQFATKKYKKGQILILGNENPSRVFYLIHGRVKQYDISYRGDEIIINTFGPNAFFPMLNPLTDLPNTYFFQADTDIEIIDAPAESVIEFLNANSDVVFDLLKRLYVGVDGMLKRMTRMMSGTTGGRILYELLLETRRFGKKNDDGSYTIPLTEVDIASRVGLSRETVSREISKLKKENILKPGQGLIVVDKAQIEERLGASL